jgi:hypothetical protein
MNILNTKTINIYPYTHIYLPHSISVQYWTQKLKTIQERKVKREEIFKYKLSISQKLN